MSKLVVDWNTMSNIATSRKYDLEERTHMFGDRSGKFVEKLPRTQRNLIYGGQLVRSSGSVGANYIEANEGLKPKSFAAFSAQLS